MISRLGGKKPDGIWPRERPISYNDPTPGSAFGRKECFTGKKVGELTRIDLETIAAAVHENGGTLWYEP